MSRPPKTTPQHSEGDAPARQGTALTKPEDVMTEPTTTSAVVRPLYLGYVRVSTAEQADSGLGLEAQSAALFTEANRRGWDIEVLADRGASGKLINPGLRKALDLLAAGRADGLLVSKMDRLARSSRHAAEIMDLAQDQGWNLVLMDMGIDLSTPPGRAMASMLATFAQFERELISARTRDALAARKASGKRLGRPSSIPAAILNRIVSEREAGNSFPMIAAGLSADGVVSPTGLRTWNESTVRRAYRSATEHAAECGPRSSERRWPEMAHIRRNTLSTSTKGRPSYSYTVVWTETLRDKFGRPIPINPTRPEGRHKTKDHQETYRTREGAQERVDELNAARNRPTGTSASEVRRLGDRTLGEYAEDWLDSMEVRVAAGKLKADTLADYRRLLSTYVLSAPAPRGTGGTGSQSRSGTRSETSRATPRRSTLGATPVAQVTPRMCESLLRDLVGRELSPKTVKHAWAQLNRVLKYAMRHDAIPSNPADRVEFDGSGVGDRAAFEHHPLTAAQVASVAAVVGERYPVYELMTLFLAYTGLRSAELSGLEVRDLELATRPTHAGTPTYTGTVHVRRTKARKGGEWRTSTPKSKRSRRSVPLPPWLAERMAGFLAEHPYGPTLPDGSPNPDHRPEASLWPSRVVGGNRIPGQLAVVPLTYEVPVSGGTFYETVLQPALAEVGLPVSRPARPATPADPATGTPAQPARPATRGVRLHDLRHTFATMQLMAGVHYLQVSRWLGHATFTLTLDTYGDWIPEAEGGVGNALPDPTAVAMPVAQATAPQEETLAQVVPLFG